MKANDVRAVVTIAEAVSVLPEHKREYLMGYAEGVVAMAETRRIAQQPMTRDSAPEPKTRT